MRLTLKQLRHVIREDMRNNAQFAPTDDDTRVPGHLPSELPKSACLEDDVASDDEYKRRVHKALGMCPTCEKPMFNHGPGTPLFCKNCEEVDEGNDIHGGGFDNKDAVYKLARRAQATR
jgi:hypothetical protein